MNTKTDNPYISFYGEHNISPVRQNIDDFRRHMMRREILFTTLGLPPIIFSNRRILEIGPGGGYNALAYFTWGAVVDLIEPNPKAQEELPELLIKYSVRKDQWRLYKDKIEDFTTNDKYDVIIAEGFLPCVPNRELIINKMAELVNPGGVIVASCMDDTSYFFEVLKRSIGHVLIQRKNINTFEAKVQLLMCAFGSHLKTLKYASRLLEDWVKDLFFLPFLNSRFFSISDCIGQFGDTFAFLGSSPSMFTNYSWYKDTDFNLRNSVREQFNMKRHVLIHYQLGESLRAVGLNEHLEKKTCEYRTLYGTVEHNLNKGNIDRLVNLLQEIRGMTVDIDARVSEAIDEAIILLLDDKIDEVKISKAEKLASAFGKGQQYVSLVNRFSREASRP